MGWNEAVDAILSLKEFATNIKHVVLKILQIFPKLLSIFVYFTDPGKVIKDAVFAFKEGVKMIFNALFGNLIRIITNPFVNKNGGKEKPKKKTCFNKSILNIILLVLCPPLAILAKNGIRDIFYIIIASFLTYFYYFPGLIYSSLYIL